jgi:DNA-binding MarR family transcriptional regulator
MQPELRLTSTQFFVLVLAALRDPTTMYDLELRAGLSSGGVKHVVASLEQAGLLRRRPSGLRRSRGLTPTEAGRQLLHSQLASILSETEFDDFKGLVRVGWSAMQLERSHGVAFLKRAAMRRDQYAEEHLAEIERLSSRDAIISSYNRMLLHCQAEQLRCEAAILRRVAAQSEQEASAATSAHRLLGT